MEKKKLADAIVRWGGPPAEWSELWKSKKTKAQLLEFVKIIIPHQNTRFKNLQIHLHRMDLKLRFFFPSHILN